MDVKLDKQSKIPVYLQIVDQLRAQIMCGALPSGSVLPSERGLAQMLEVHRNTVVKAYGELKSDAWIESRQGIGYVVAVPPAAEDGGYRLSRELKDYSVGEIVRLTEGSLAPVSCLEGENTCPRADKCLSLPVWEKLDTLINDYLDSVSLADLLAEGGGNGCGI